MMSIRTFHTIRLISTFVTAASSKWKWSAAVAGRASDCYENAVIESSFLTGKIRSKGKHNFEGIIFVIHCFSEMRGYPDRPFESDLRVTGRVHQAALE